MTKINGSPPSFSPISTSTPSETESVAADLGVEAPQTESTSVESGFEFPRRGWQDPAALSAAIEETKQTLADLYRMQFMQESGSSKSPPLQMRYGLPADPVIPSEPPIAMRYGLPAPSEPSAPPIAMRYGLPAPSEPETPPIAMRYGLPAPSEPETPPIAMRYGLPAPSEPDVVPTKSSKFSIDSE